jgi:predicted RNase H-like HicB family nuclease
MKTAFGLLSVHRFPGCVSQGRTKEEALENVKDAIKLCLQVRGEQGLPLTIETKQVEVAA